MNLPISRNYIKKTEVFNLISFNQEGFEPSTKFLMVFK